VSGQLCRVAEDLSCHGGTLTHRHPPLSPQKSDTGANPVPKQDGLLHTTQICTTRKFGHDRYKIVQAKSRPPGRLSAVIYIYIYIYIIIYTYIPGPSWIRRRQRRWRGVRQQRRRGGLLPTPFLMQHQHRRSPAKKKSESASSLSCFRVKIQLTKDGKSIAAFDPLEILIKKNKDLLEGVTAFYTLAILRTQHASLQVCVCVCVCVCVYLLHTLSLSLTQHASLEARAEVLKSQYPSTLYDTKPQERLKSQCPRLFYSTKGIDF